MQPSPLSLSPARDPQELRVFLEAEGSLAASPQWQQLQPARGTLVEGIARLPRQLIGVRAGAGGWRVLCGQAALAAAG